MGGGRILKKKKNTLTIQVLVENIVIHVHKRTYCWKIFKTIAKYSQNYRLNPFFSTTCRYSYHFPYLIVHILARRTKTEKNKNSTAIVNFLPILSMINTVRNRPENTQRCQFNTLIIFRGTIVWKINVIFLKARKHLLEILSGLTTQHTLQAYSIIIKFLACSKKSLLNLHNYM